MHALDLDCRTVLGPWIPVSSEETLRRLLAYLGATPTELEDFDFVMEKWGQGSTMITLVPGRKNLLQPRNE